MMDFRSFMKQWAPGESAEDSSAIFAYSISQMIMEVLKNCGDDLSREKLIKQATNINGLQLPLFIPGVKINISPTSRIAWRQAWMARFDGTKWVFFGDIVASPANN
jgi:branched-chain amino acid transport system substrate-binding protein